MLIKSFVFIISIISLTANAVLLKDGSFVPYNKAIKVWCALQDLHRNKARSALSWLWKISMSKDNTRIPSFVIEKMEDGTTLDTIRESELCNEYYEIDKDTAAVIRSSVAIFFYEGVVPLYINVYNPISWKSYFFPSHWKELSRSMAPSLKWVKSRSLEAEGGVLGITSRARKKLR